MKSASILPLILATHWKMRTGDGITFPRFCSGFAMARCLAANQVPGFAPFRGGPVRFAEHFGVKKVVDELERLAQAEEKFLPCEILKKHARDGTKFYES